LSAVSTASERGLAPRSVDAACSQYVAAESKGRTLAAACSC